MLMSEKKNEPSYSVSGFEKIINWLINTLFFYRLLFVTLSIVVLWVITYRVWINSDTIDRYKNISLVFAFGSIVIGIFYSILNYEHNQIKYKKDIKHSKLTLSFNAASEWHRPTMVENLKITKQLYDKNKHLIDDNKAVDFFNMLEQDEEARSALVSIFNFMECISTGVLYGILDTSFMRNYFYSVFMTYNNNYGFYIKYRRNVNNAHDAWINYTNLTQNWQDA